MTVANATSSAREWLQAQKIGAPMSHPTMREPKMPPIQSDVTLCNTDAAWIASTQRAGLGWHFNTPEEDINREGSRAMENVSSPLMVEALAMREAVLEAKRSPILKFWFRTDSQELARAIYSKTYPVELFGVLMDIEYLSSFFSSFFVSFVGREHNAIADSLAKSALHTLPPCLY